VALGRLESRPLARDKTQVISERHTAGRWLNGG